MNHLPSLPHFKWDEAKVVASGPFSTLNPTTRRYALHLQPRKEEGPQTEDLSDESKIVEESNCNSKSKKHEFRARDVFRVYRTRDNRKGRHAIEISQGAADNARFLTPLATNTLKATLKGIGRMFTWYPVWDVSYLVAAIFTIGSVIWVINSFFVWLPLQDPSTEFNGEIYDAGGITAFIGATIFEIGSILLMLEAVNENRADCFGWALEEVLEEEGLIRLKKDGCTHSQKNKRSLFGRAKSLGSKKSSEASQNHSQSSSSQTWTWWPTWHEITTHYLREIGFLACSAQMAGASIFWISGFTALPPIYDRLTSIAAQNGAYWLPQVIGGTGFIISGTLFMIEVQEKWYLPAPKVLGWHIGVWNLMGGIGFMLCGALGFGAANSGCAYQGSLATFWGSWCFLIGSVIQWYESLNKHPVEVEQGGGRVGDTQPVA